MLKLSSMFLSLWIIPTYAYAYIDPGTGSIALQVVFATVAAGWLFFGRLKNAVINLFRRRD